MIILLNLIILLISIELLVIVFINFLQSRIPWIITNKDEYPVFEKIKIKTFLRKTYDPILGWNWKPKTKHQEKLNSKYNNIFFGNLGERKSSFSKKNKYEFASFGDSFVFCRFVKNNETWQSYLNKLTSINGLNFGVGNFGLDQIFLKYSSTKIPKSIKTVFIGFVPETLSRCLCSWRHYYEFNNIYAFKPKFDLSKKKLILMKNPIEKNSSFNKIFRLIDKLKHKEFFYKEKFLRYKFNFPYIYSFFKNTNYNFMLIFFSFLKILNINQNKLYDFIINENCKKNDDYFSKKKNENLIYQLMTEIKKISKKKKHKIVILVFPQKYDLEIKNKNYQKFFSKIKNRFNIIDFTEIFEKEDVDKLYLPGRYGGHLTAYGNKIVAKTLIERGIIN